jgi:hypothetical protein
LDWLLRQFRFAAMSDVLDQIDAALVVEPEQTMPYHPIPAPVPDCA